MADKLRRDILEYATGSGVNLSPEQADFLTEKFDKVETAMNYYYEQDGNFPASIPPHDRSAMPASLITEEIRGALLKCGVTLTIAELNYLASRSTTGEKAVVYYYQNQHEFGIVDRSIEVEAPIQTPQKSEGLSLSPLQRDIYTSLSMYQIVVTKAQIEFLALRCNTGQKAVEYYFENTVLVQAVSEPKGAQDDMEALSPLDKEIFDALLTFQVRLTKPQVAYLAKRCNTAQKAVSYYFENEATVNTVVEDEIVVEKASGGGIAAQQVEPVNLTSLLPLEREIYDALFAYQITLSKAQVKFLSLRCNTGQKAVNHYFENTAAVLAVEVESVPVADVHAAAEIDLELLPPLERQIFQTLSDFKVRLTKPQLAYLAKRCNTADKATNYYFDNAEVVLAVIEDMPPEKGAAIAEGATEPPDLALLLPLERDICEAALHACQAALSKAQVKFLAQRCNTADKAVNYYLENTAAVLAVVEAEAKEPPLDVEALPPLEREIHDSLLLACQVRLTKAQLVFLSKRCNTGDKAVNYYIDNSAKVLAVVAEAVELEGLTRLEQEIHRVLSLQGVVLTAPQMKYLSKRNSSVERAMNYFFDRSEEVLAVLEEEPATPTQLVQCVLCGQGMVGDFVFTVPCPSAHQACFPCMMRHLRACVGQDRVPCCPGRVVPAAADAAADAGGGDDEDDDDDAEDEEEGKGDLAAALVHRTQKAQRVQRVQRARLEGAMPQLPPPAAVGTGLPFLPLPRPRFVAPAVVRELDADDVADLGDDVAGKEGGLVLGEGEGEPCPWEFSEMEMEQFLGDARGFVEAADRDALRITATRCFQEIELQRRRDAQDWTIAPRPGDPAAARVRVYPIPHDSVRNNVTRELTEFNIACSQFARLLNKLISKVTQVEVIEYDRYAAVRTRFEAAKQRLAAAGRPVEEVLIFHGTEDRNLGPIVHDGFKVGGVDAGVGVRNGTAYGNGVYTAIDTAPTPHLLPPLATGPATPVQYSRGGNKVILAKALPGLQKALSRPDGDCDSWRPPQPDWVLFARGDQLLPCYIIHFNNT